MQVNENANDLELCAKSMYGFWNTKLVKLGYKLFAEINDRAYYDYGDDLSLVLVDNTAAFPIMGEDYLSQFLEVIYKDQSVGKKLIKTEDDLEEVLFFVDNIRIKGNLVLLVGIPWAGKILDRMLK